MSAQSTRPNTRDARPHVVIAHHYMWPDESPTARLFSDLAFHLAGLGCRVTVLAARERYVLRLADLRERETRDGVDFIRVRGGQGFRKGGMARLLAGFSLQLKWLLRMFTLPRADIFITGTDPPFSSWLGAVLKVLRRADKTVVWSMDLYPDAIIAEGLAREDSPHTRLCRALNEWSHKHTDAIVDLGLCMRARMRCAHSAVRRETITPWAPHEPQSTERDAEAERTRREVFGTSRIALLYSGAFGRAHDLGLFARLAANLALTGPDFRVAFCSHGPAFVQFRSKAAMNSWPVTCLDFDPGESYLARLAAADFHLVSVKPEWSGIVVPSKFFAALAMGRPVIAAVPDSSSIAALCAEHDLGWVLNDQNLDKVAEALRQILIRPERLRSWQRHVREKYQKFFSRRAGLEAWRRLLA